MLDISIDYLTQITDSSILRILCNAEEIPLESNSINTIICTDVFEHVENEMNLVGEISRLLPVGGQLLLATPWEQDLSVYETEEYITKYKKYDFVHFR